MFEFKNFKYFSMFKGTVSVISSDPQLKEDKARFTMVPFKIFCSLRKVICVCKSIENRLKTKCSTRKSVL